VKGNFKLQNPNSKKPPTFNLPHVRSRRSTVGIWNLMVRWSLVFGVWIFAPPAESAVLDKDSALAAHTWWDNRDFDWYKANIPFFECPNADIVTTYYYRWELITKHLTYGSPTSGYSFTEFIDRPFWSGTYGAISCPSGLQLYEVRWLAERRLAQDYARYWFRTEGAQPRRYSTWLADAVWATHMVQDEAAFAKDLLADLVKNYGGWEKTHFVPEVGLFWQVGHDDGMEYNIASRQTKATFNGAPSFRPSFNAYMWADAQAIARIADLSGDKMLAQKFRAKADALKSQMQQWLWDPKREFFLIRFKNEEECDPKNWPGQKINAHTFIYEDGPFAGSSQGRELIGYVPWQFNMLDVGRGFERAWRFLMDPKYFYAPFGPSFVGRNDPLFRISPTCCWWSGQSWPYANSQMLTALANLLHNSKQDVITRADYVKLLHIYAKTHRKDGKPFIAEAAHPDTGSWDGHNSYNHSEHYFHSSFNDLVISGLVGLKPRADDVLEIDPLAPADWNYFALDDVPYHGRKVSIVWDKDGKRYGKGAGLRVIVDEKEIATLNHLGKITAKLPEWKERGPSSPPGETSVRADLPVRAPMNFAVNNDGNYFPRVTASFTDPKTPLHKVNDGDYWYTLHPPNRWTTAGSTNAQDWLMVDFGVPRRINTLKLYFLDDGANVVAPESYEIQLWNEDRWRVMGLREEPKIVPSKPEGHRANVISFKPFMTPRVRVTFTHAKNGRTGLSEIEAWGDAVENYAPGPPPSGNIAPKATASASFSDRYGGVPQLAIDGKVHYRTTPVNRWTSFGSTNTTDWLQLDFTEPQEISRAVLYIFDDRGGVQAPAGYRLQMFANGEWRDVPAQKKNPEKPAGNIANEVTFPRINTDKLRILFTHKGKSRSGVSEVELWRE
jgi:hypothetical protein